MIKATNKITGSLNASIIKQYPELEDVTVEPSLEEQKIKSNIFYGINEITVKEIPATELSILPTEQKQIAEGIFKKVVVEAIPDDYVVPTIEEELLNLSRGKVSGGVLEI
jgi:hypothetical protein